MAVSQRELLILVLAAGCLVLAVSAMAALHERHYRTREERISAARATGHIEDRLRALEEILSEDRLT